MAKPKNKPANDQRQGRMRAAGDLVGTVGGAAFRRFGFVQGAVVSRWNEIVGDKYGAVSLPESIRFPAGARKGGTLTLLVEGAHAPLVQHLGPMIIDRVNRFFGYDAVARIVFRQGRLPARPKVIERPVAAPVSEEIGEGLRAIADPELRACLESLAGQIAGTKGPPAIASSKTNDIPIIRSIPET